MYAYRVAPRPGSVLAPRLFIQQLRRETRCKDLHCWWDPTCNRVVVLKDGREETRLGCWVVWQRIRVLRHYQVGRAVVGVATTKWVDVFRLNGEYGNPTTIGPWVAKALNMSDMTKRGNHARPKFLNDLNEAAAMEPAIQARKFAEDFVKDKFVKRIFQKTARERGVPIRTKEDINAIHKVLLERQRREWEETEAFAKSLRYRRELVE